MRLSTDEVLLMATFYKFWFRAEIAEQLAQRYSYISLNELLALQPPSTEVRKMWELTVLDDLYVSVFHLGKEQNQPHGYEIEVHVVQVASNAPHDALIELFKKLGGFYVNSVEVPD